MATQSLGRETLTLVERWEPKRAYRHERKFQSDLQDYLQASFRERHRDPIDVGTERGTSRGDVVVADRVGIELKNRFDNGQENKLRDQLYDYREEYEFVIACTCGIEDWDGWERIKDELTGGMAGPFTTPVYFVVKRLGEGGGRRRDDRSDGGNGRHPTSMADALGLDWGP